MPLTPAGTIQRWNAATMSWNLTFRQNLAQIPTFWEQIATRVPSDTREEDYAWLDRAPMMREFLGERVITNPAVRLQSITNRKFELTVGIPREDISDDKLGVYDAIIPEVARAARIFPDVLLATAMQNGGTATVYDGQNFFDASHPVNPDNAAQVIAGTAYTTQPNLFTGAASGNQPGALPLSAANLAIAYQTMTSWVGPDGQPMYVLPDTLIVPPQLAITAREILHGEFLGGDVALTGGTHGAASKDNNAMRGLMQPLVLPYLANDPTTYYLACTTRATKPWVFQDREAPEFTVLTRPTDQDAFMHDRYLYGVRTRCNVGYGQWWLAAQVKAS